MKTPFQFGCLTFFDFNGPDSMTPAQFKNQINLVRCRGSVKRSQGIEEEEKKKKKTNSRYDFLANHSLIQKLNDLISRRINHSRTIKNMCPIIREIA